MTRDVAARWRYERAGMKSLDDAAAMRCSERREGCTLYPFGVRTAPLEALDVAGYGGMVVPCDRHQPSKRYAWLFDVPLEAIEAQPDNGAWQIDVLRKYLPRTHLEYRP